VRKRSFRVRFQRPVAPALAHSEGRLTLRAIGLKVNSHTNVTSMSNSVRLTKHHDAMVSCLHGSLESLVLIAHMRNSK